MYNDISKPAPPLPETVVKELQPGVTLVHPLSRRGYGPGLILLSPDTDDILAIREGVPSLTIKWAEEGYTVVSIQENALSSDVNSLLKSVADAFSTCEKCEPKNKIGLAAYGSSPWNQIAPSLSSIEGLSGAVVYAAATDAKSLAKTSVPVLTHLAGIATDGPTATPGTKSYNYAKVETHEFAVPFGSAFHYNTEALSHTRSLMFLKPLMDGPYFDLEAIWDEHCYYEFADRSVEHTMSTMVAEPYVNHVPTLTGGIGRGPLTKFYRDNFIFNNSADTDLELLSRTIGIDRVIDEFIFKFTHDRPLDWLLPGVPPTFRKVEVPFTAVINIRGDRLYHEHISWDNMTVLMQLGLMPEYLPFNAPATDGHTNGHSNGTMNGSTNGKSTKLEYRVPTAGIEVASKMRDRNSVPSNQMFEYKVREA